MTATTMGGASANSTTNASPGANPTPSTSSQELRTLGVQLSEAGRILSGFAGILKGSPLEAFAAPVSVISKTLESSGEITSRIANVMEKIKQNSVVPQGLGITPKSTLGGENTTHSKASVALQSGTSEVERAGETAASTIRNAFKNAAEGIRVDFKGVAKGTESLFSAIGKSLKNSLLSALSDVASKALSGLVGRVFGGIFQGFSTGASGFSTGGYVSGGGTSTSDSIPAMLSDGEFVVNANATRANRPLLEGLNKGGVLGGAATSVIVHQSFHFDGTYHPSHRAMVQNEIALTQPATVAAVVDGMNRGF